MADQDGFLASLPVIGGWFKNKTEVIDTPVTSTPIPDEGSLNTTPMVVLPDEAPAKTENSVPAPAQPVTPATPPTPATPTSSTKP